jgi:hypothetical protein
MIFLRLIKIFIDFLDYLTKRLEDSIVKEQSPIENKMETLESTLKLSHDWALDRITYLTDSENTESAFALLQEFEEWFDPEIEEHDIISVGILIEEGT